MSISELILNRQSEGKNIGSREINVYRAIILFCASFTILLRYLFVHSYPESFDPLWIRIIFSSLFLGFFFASYISRIGLSIAYFIFAAYNFYSLFLIYKNNFSLPYLLEFTLSLIVFCLNFKKKIYIYTYFSLIFFSYSLLCIFLRDSLLDILIGIAFLGIFCSAILVLFSLKLKAEEELGVREDLLNTIFNESPDALFLIDPGSSLISYCNNRATVIFEIGSKEKIIGSNLNLLLKHPYSPGSWTNLKKKVGKKRFLIHELEFKTASNYTFWGSRAITEINVGRTIYWLVRISDITERMRDKKTIEDNRKMLRQVVDLVPHQIFLKDNEGRFIMVNKAVSDSYETTAEMMVGKKDDDFSNATESKKFMEDDREVMDKIKPKIIPEERFTDKSGFTRILQTTKIPFYLDEGSKPGVLGIGIDITERVRDKQIIEENRKLLTQIINVLPHHIYLKDSKGKFLLVNQSLADFMQVKMEDIIGKTDYDFFSKKNAQMFYEVEQEVIRTGKSKQIIEEYFDERIGEVRIKNAAKMPFFINEKNEKGILGVNIDITEDKFAEKALKESETKYKMLMEQASDGIYLSDKDGNIIEANQKACEMFGYSAEEFLKINIKKLVDPKGLKDAPVRIPGGKDKQSIIVERRFLKKDGSSFTVELSAKLLEDGRHQAIIRDITERKRLERILKDNERKFRALIENSSDIILIVGEDFKLKFTSPSVLRIFGIESEKLINKSLFEYVYHEDIDIFSKFLSEILSDPENPHILEEVRLKGNSEKYIYAEVVGTNMLKDMVVSGIIINCHDITKRKRTEKELLNTNFELDSFVYKGSHDLKAPLRSVMGLIKLSKLESKDKIQHTYLDMMNKSVLSLDQFIKDLTLFSRNSRMDVESKEIKFEELINESLNSIKFLDNADKITVYKIIHNHSKFYSDITRLGAIFNNLISNAFKYHRFENNNPYINIIIEFNDERAEIIVEDNGQGIEAVYLDHIFEMFYRASESSYGSGLGLYIVKNAINKLNGTISVESVVGQGSKFTVVIPNLINKIAE